MRWVANNERKVLRTRTCLLIFGQGPLPIQPEANLQPLQPKYQNGTKKHPGAGTIALIFIARTSVVPLGFNFLAFFFALLRHIHVYSSSSRRVHFFSCSEFSQGWIYPQFCIVRVVENANGPLAESVVSVASKVVVTTQNECGFS